MARHGVEQHDGIYVKIQPTRTFRHELAITRAELEAQLHNPAIIAVAHLFRQQLDEALRFDNG